MQIIELVKSVIEECLSILDNFVENVASWGKSIIQFYGL